MTKIAEIKRLAKESLEKKWYPLRRGDDKVHISDDCAFCIDARERDESSICSTCYLSSMEPDICKGITLDNIEETILSLEQLAEFGELI